MTIRLRENILQDSWYTARKETFYVQDSWYTARKGTFYVQDSCTLQVPCKFLTRFLLLTKNCARNVKFLAQFLQVLQVSCKKRDIFSARSVHRTCKYLQDTFPWGGWLLSSQKVVWLLTIGYFRWLSLDFHLNRGRRSEYTLYWSVTPLHFWTSRVLYRSYRVNNKVIDVLYILIYYYTGILFVVLREGWVSYTSLFKGNLPWRARTIRD